MSKAYFDRQRLPDLSVKFDRCRSCNYVSKAFDVGRGCQNCGKPAQISLSHFSYDVHALLELIFNASSKEEIEENSNSNQFALVLFFSTLVKVLLHHFLINLMTQKKLKDEERSEFQGETQLPQESKFDVQRSEQKATIEKLGESERYHSALDGFICYFPEEPSILPAQSSGLVFRGYQASEILAEQGFILYSVSFSNNTDKISFAETTEEAKQVLHSTLEEFRKSHSSNSKREAFTRFGTFLDRYAIEYKIHFTHNTVECIGQEIFLLDKHRIIKISSSYPKDIERLGLTKYHEFKESFVLIDK